MTHIFSARFFVKSSGHFSEAEICVFFAGGVEAKFFKLFAGCKNIFFDRLTDPSPQNLGNYPQAGGKK